MSDARLAQWRAAWPQALAHWSRYVRLHEPLLCVHSVEAAAAGLSGSFAMIRLSDQSVVVDLAQCLQLGLDDYAVEILAHEIGHHVCAPASLSDQFRLLARIRSGLPTLEKYAPLVANLYTDLLINDRLQRQSGLRMADIYQRLAAAQSGPASTLWSLYMGIYESLWQLDFGALGGPLREQAGHADAYLGARLIRVYAGDWLAGAGGFAALMLPYLAAMQSIDEALQQLQDTRDAAHGGAPSGGLEIEAGEDKPLHPAHDPRVSGAPVDATGDAAGGAPPNPGQPSRGGQLREPFEYGELLRASGLDLSAHDVAVRYYRERALPHLLPFPKRPSPQRGELQPEGVQTWELGDPLEQIDWLQSVLVSPLVIPGLTTMQRVYGESADPSALERAADLDIYIDSSGSMPNPQHNCSYLALAGTIIVLSALRAGARVQATLWSGKNQFLRTPGFVRDEDAILRVLTGHFGGGTAFPIHLLRDTYAARKPDDHPVHVLMVSDDGITTMFDKDERGGDGFAITRQSLAKARGGGTMVLQLPDNWASPGARHYAGDFKQLMQARDEDGWLIYPIRNWTDLTGFAQRFVRHHYRTLGATEHAAGQRA